MPAPIPHPSPKNPTPLVPFVVMEWSQPVKHRKSRQKSATKSSSGNIKTLGRFHIPGEGGLLEMLHQQHQFPYNN